ARGPLQGQEPHRHRRLPHRRPGRRVVRHAAARGRARRRARLVRGDPARRALARQRTLARPPAGAAGGPARRRLSTRVYAVVFIGALGALLLLGVTASIVKTTAAFRDGVALETPVKIFVFAVFLAMGFSAMPLMLRLF